MKVRTIGKGYFHGTYDIAKQHNHSQPLYSNFYNILSTRTIHKKKVLKREHMITVVNKYLHKCYNYRFQLLESNLILIFLK